MASFHPYNLPLEVYSRIIDFACELLPNLPSLDFLGMEILTVVVHLKEEIYLPPHSDYVIPHPDNPQSVAVDTDASPSWIDECQLGVAQRQLWSTFRDGRLMIDPGLFRGLYLANKAFKQLIDTYRWRHETVLRIELSQRATAVKDEDLKKIPVVYFSVLDDLK